MSVLSDLKLELPKAQTLHPEVLANASYFPLWFNRGLSTPTVPDELVPYTSGRHFISTKQVPSSLLLRAAGSSSVRMNREMLLRKGFTLRESTRSYQEATRDLTVRRLHGDLPAESGTLASLLMEVQDTMDTLLQDSADIDEDYDSSGSEASDAEVILEKNKHGKQVRFRNNCRYRIRYEDPWKIHAGRVLAESMGKTVETVMWSGDGIRLQDPLPPRLLGSLWSGNRKNQIRFSAIGLDECKFHLIQNHTHWGKALNRMCNTQDEHNLFSWARLLRTRINRFLRGKTDPVLSERQLQAIFANPHEVRDRKARSLRFIELLKTVDGIFLQRYLCYPEEVWTWERFDMFTLGNLSILLSDEFLDGDLTPEGMAIDTCYAQLKRARKWFKSKAHTNDLKRALSDDIPIAPWCLQFVNVWKRACLAREERYTYCIGVLSQTRGCGTPPPIVLLQAKNKFLRTISMEPPPQSATMAALRREALQEVLKELPDSAFTGLSTKARVTVTTSACWEDTRKRGGTTEEIRRILHSGDTWDQIPVRDLDTGRVTSHIDMESGRTLGELIFWSSLDHVLRAPPEALRCAFLTVVKEPGKARSVTKARACLKIVLDVVNKLCSEPLAKGIRSSTSGMAAANHGWNLFIDLFKADERSEVFHLLRREENPYEGYVEVTDTFTDLFFSSTDYEEATDQMRLEVASELGNAWMIKCGIPRILRGIVQATCFNPRQVYFWAKGPLATIGTPAPHLGENIRVVTLSRGILMGDPLTKVVLHLTNVVTRRIGKRLSEPSFYNRFENGNAAFESFYRGAKSFVRR